jgi:putative transposase
MTAYYVSACGNWQSRGSGLAVLVTHLAEKRGLGGQSQADGEDISRRRTGAAEKAAQERRCRALAIVDDYSRECPAIEVDTSLGGRRVVGVLERLSEIRGLPEVITIDNGPEFAGRALDEWAYRKGVKLNFIRPGKPIENAFAESFIGRLRDECLNTNWFMNLRHARDIIEDWRKDYNEVRPHSSLKGATPKEYAEITVGL